MSVTLCTRLIQASNVYHFFFTSTVCYALKGSRYFQNHMLNFVPIFLFVVNSDKWILKEKRITNQLNFILSHLYNVLTTFSL